jgi:hypothetical protein
VTRGGELLFQARTGSLCTDKKSADWREGEGECIMCRKGKEDEEHVILRCERTEGVRSERLVKLRDKRDQGKNEKGIMAMALGLGEKKTEEDTVCLDVIRVLIEWEKVKAKMLKVAERNVNS